jgi:hypothetical protein
LNFRRWKTGERPKIRFAPGDIFQGKIK